VVVRVEGCSYPNSCGAPRTTRLALPGLSLGQAEELAKAPVELSGGSRLDPARARGSGELGPQAVDVPFLQFGELA
jgi:hypothetical protein